MLFKKIYYLLFAASFFNSAYGQFNNEVVRLKNLTISGKSDSSKVQAFYLLGDLFLQSNTDSAFYYYESGKKLARKQNNYLMEGYSHGYVIIPLNDKGKYNEALDACLEAEQLFIKAKATKKDFATVYINLGNEWQYLGSFKNAASNYYKAINLSEELKNENIEVVAVNNLSSLYGEIKDTVNQYKFALKAKKIAVQMNDSSRIFSSTVNLIAALVSNKKFDEAKQQLEELIKMSESLADPEYKLDANITAADYYIETKNYDKAINCCNIILDEIKEQANKEYELAAYKNLAIIYFAENNLVATKVNAVQGLEIAKNIEASAEEIILIKLLADIAEKNGNAKEALSLIKKWEILKDNSASKAAVKEAMKLEAEYQTEKKENRIAIQTIELKRKNILNILFGIGLLTSTLFSFLFYKNYQQKKKLQQQQITKLLTEKNLLATTEVLKGEEQERSRLAKDLHDGLGGMLSGLKFSLNTMKQNMIMTPENFHRFERSIDMLDNSITEMRRVAHNMMPEALVRFGIDTALKDYCNDINQTGALVINYQSKGTIDGNVEQSKAISIFRIIQELINNIMKHAEAKNAIVQILENGKQLFITIEDDGKGFDINIIDNINGIGFKNIKNRINFLKGKLDIKSEKGIGTSVYFEINI